MGRGRLFLFQVLMHLQTLGLLGGSWVVISGVTSRVTIIITRIRGLITPLITTHEPPSVDRPQALFSDLLSLLHASIVAGMNCYFRVWR